MTLTPPIPVGYALRHPEPDDLPAVAALLAVVTAMESGAPDFTEQELQGHWEALPLENDAWLTISPDHDVVGYAALHHQDHTVLQAEAYVHPNHVGLGIGSCLLETALARAHTHVALAATDAQVLIYNAINADNEAARRVLTRNGFTPCRHFWRMIMDLTQPVPLPSWPHEIAVRTWASDADDHVAYLTLEDAFQDHWAHLPVEFETWRRKGDAFDPGLWLLAFDGEECAGVLTAHHHLEMGWVEQLGVRRAWRGRGIGMALLLHAFGTFVQRGWTQAGLDVDAASETGATRLYARVGMRSAAGQATTVYQKELRPAALCMTSGNGSAT